MVGADAQGLPAIDYVFAKSEGEACYAFFGLLVAYGVVVDGAQHAAEVGIVAVGVLSAYHFLQYDGHLLLVDDVARGSHVGLRVFVIH